MELPTPTKTTDLFIEIIDHLLDENRRLRNSLDMERSLNKKRRYVEFGGTYSRSKLK